MWAALSFVIAMVALSLAGFDAAAVEETDPGPNAALVWVLYGALFSLTALHVRAQGAALDSIYGEVPYLKESLRLAAVGLPMIGIALFCIYVVFAPLSLIWPDWVHWWLFEDLVPFYSAERPYPVLANTFGLAAIVVVAPLVEEWIFRGLLLRRWTQKWGTMIGVIGSSLVFAVAHVDLLGAFIFGVVMCGLYARYRSLWIPVIVHAANNAVAAAWEVVMAHGGVTADTSLDSFRAAWWLPLVGASLFVPWVLRIRTTLIPVSGWQFGARSDELPTT